MALGAKRLGKDFHTWVMLGDGEIEEGMVWESVLCAPRYRLDNLTAIIDVNGLQQYGWACHRADRFDRRRTGRSRRPPGGVSRLRLEHRKHRRPRFHPDPARARQAAGHRGVTGKPTVILARTEKGHGLTFTAGTYKWHNGVASADQLAAGQRKEVLCDVEPAA